MSNFARKKTSGACSPRNIMKILSNHEIRELEKLTASQYGVSVLDQIENAGALIADEIQRGWPVEVPVTVFAGWGNNGADAMCAASRLLENGYSVSVYIFNVKAGRMTAQCRAMRDRLKKSRDERLEIHEITGRDLFAMPHIQPGSLVIDGLFGSGLSGALPRVFEMLIKSINDSGADIVAVDMPSGLHSDDNENRSVENMIHATLTLAETAPRLSFMLSEFSQAVGEWKVLDIGVSSQAIRQAPYTYYLVRRSTVAPFLKRRPQFCSKADFGSAMIAAGSTGMYGAAVMAATGCLRAGAGKVTVHSAQAGMPVLQTAQPSAMFKSDLGHDHITDMSGWKKYDAIAVGPGIGTHNQTIEALEVLLKTANAAGQPLVIDADALNCMALKPIMLDYLPVLSVLTPHAGEFDRLFGQHDTDWQRIERAIAVAAFNKVIIVLKGRFTAIVRPDGKVFFNASGCPAMATPGSGDVLTGVLAAFMAQGYKPEKATLIACCVHGTAGELVQAEQGEYGATASDIADNIGKAIRLIMNQSR